MYNKNIDQINKFVKSNRYNEAYKSLQKLENTTIYRKKDLQEFKILLAIKLHKPLEIENTNVNLDDILINGYLLGQSNRKKSALNELIKGINFNQDSDTLIKAFEIYSMRNNNEATSTKLIIDQQIIETRNTKLKNNEAVILLNLMRKKEKILTN